MSHGKWKVRVSRFQDTVEYCMGFEGVIRNHITKQHLLYIIVPCFCCSPLWSHKLREAWASWVLIQKKISVENLSVHALNQLLSMETGGTAWLAVPPLS